MYSVFNVEGIRSLTTSNILKNLTRKKMFIDFILFCFYPFFKKRPGKIHVHVVVYVYIHVLNYDDLLLTFVSRQSTSIFLGWTFL